MVQRLLSQFNHNCLKHSSINSTQVKTRNSENRNSISKSKDSKDLSSCHIHFDPSTSHSVLKSLKTRSIQTFKLSFLTINNHHNNHISYFSSISIFSSYSLSFLITGSLLSILFTNHFKSLRSSVPHHLFDQNQLFHYGSSIHPCSHFNFSCQLHDLGFQ